MIDKLVDRKERINEAYKNPGQNDGNTMTDKELFAQMGSKVEVKTDGD